MLWVPIHVTSQVCGNDDARKLKTAGGGWGGGEEEEGEEKIGEFKDEENERKAGGWGRRIILCSRKRGGDRRKCGRKEIVIYLHYQNPNDGLCIDWYYLDFS